MTVSVIGGQLKIALTETEITKYNIDRVFFDKAGDDSGKALVYLLELASVMVGFKPNTTDFQIEMYPIFSGGCEIYYIPKFPQSQKTEVKRWSLFEFDTSDGMLQATEWLFGCEKIRYLTSVLYKLNSKYRLAVKGMPFGQHRTVQLSFADRYFSTSQEFIKTVTKGKIIVPQNAIAIIGSAMCSQSLE